MISTSSGLGSETRQWGTFLIRKYTPEMEDGKLPNPVRFEEREKERKELAGKRGKKVKRVK